MVAKWELTYFRGNWTNANFRTYETLDELAQAVRGLSDDPFLTIEVRRYGAPYQIQNAGLRWVMWGNGAALAHAQFTQDSKLRGGCCRRTDAEAASAPLNMPHCQVCEKIVKRLIA